MPEGYSQPATLFSYISPEERIPQDHPLNTIRTIAEAMLRAIPDDAIYEAVFRHHLQHAIDQPHPIPHYLSLRGGDPGKKFMHRLRDLAPWVKQRSQCRLSARDGVTDRETGTRGRIVEVTSLSWIDEAVVDVVGGYYEAPLKAAAVLYHVKHDEDRWVVKATRLVWRA